jgi:hypothetical protein
VVVGGLYSVVVAAWPAVIFLWLLGECILLLLLMQLGQNLSPGCDVGYDLVFDVGDIMTSS